MKKAGKLVTGLLGLAMAAVTVMPAMAAMPAYVYDFKIWLPPDMEWNSAARVTHDSNYNGAKARCETVYPDDGGHDTYTTIRYRLTGSHAELISKDSYVKITEGAGFVATEIKQGYNNLGFVGFEFQGNTKYSADAYVSYNGNAYVP